MKNIRPVLGAAALLAACLAGPACKPGIKPKALTSEPRITGEWDTCRGEAVDLAPDESKVVVTCRSGEAVVVPLGPPGSAASAAPVLRVPDAGSGEGIRFHPSGAFAVVSGYRLEACADGHANPGCQPPYDSALGIIGFPRPEVGPPVVLEKIVLADGGETCLGGEDVDFSADGRVLAVACNKPHRVFLFDFDPASPTFGQKLHRVDIEQSGGRTGWLDEVAINGDASRVFVSDIEIGAEGVGKDGVIQEIDGVTGKLRPPVYKAEIVAGLSIDRTGRYLTATVWDHGATRIDLNAAANTKEGRKLLRHQGGMSYDVSGDGTYAYAVTQYPGRLDVYDFEGEAYTSLDLPSRTSNMPTSTVARRDRSEIFAQVETGKLHAIATGLAAPTARITRMGLADPCAPTTKLSWEVKGASAVELEGVGPVPAMGEREVTADETARHVLKATLPGGVERAVAVQWRPDHKYTRALCGAPAAPEPPPTPPPSVPTPPTAAP